MAWDTFKSIIDTLPKEYTTVSLQGEGEPTLHPRFWDMVSYVRRTGRSVYTITNGTTLGSRKERLSFYGLFNSFGVSIDETDREGAARTGRHLNDNVINNLRAFVKTSRPGAVTIFSVDYGQDLTGVRALAKELGVSHVIQPLQTSINYTYRYQNPVDFKQDWSACTFDCSYVKLMNNIYFNIDGVKLPCCFIKDLSYFVSAESIREEMERKEVPLVCQGCAVIFPTVEKIKPTFFRKESD